MGGGGYVTVFQDTIIPRRLVVWVYWREREKKEEGKEKGKRRERIELFILFNVIVYIILISCM